MWIISRHSPWIGESLYSLVDQWLYLSLHISNHLVVPQEKSACCAPVVVQCILMCLCRADISAWSGSGFSCVCVKRLHVCGRAGSRLAITGSTHDVLCSVALDFAMSRSQNL